jgi:hypothetical protein
MCTLARGTLGLANVPDAHGIASGSLRARGAALDFGARAGTAAKLEA